MAQRQAQPRHLRELLREDQEPFLLQTYIASKRSQLKTVIPTPKAQLQLKKRKPIISSNSNFATKFCKSACFFSSSFHDSSPDPTRSPLYYNTNFPSPSKSPCKNNPNPIFLHVPAKTSAVLLEAALRIRKNSATKNVKHGILGSLLKRLTNRSKTQNRDFFEHGRGSLDNKAKKRKPFEADNHNHHHHVGSLEEKTQICPCNSSSRRTSTSCLWTDESHVSSRCNRSLDTEEIGLCSDDAFCESPFRFVLQRSPSPSPSPSPSSSGTRTPEFASSPSRHKDTSDKDVETLKKLQVEQEEEEDKEQCSPVSVLDPPFEDDDEADDGRDDHDGDEGMDGYNYKTSYAIVQRAKENLLRKLSRFERLAELDPVELEKRLMEDDGDDDDISLIEDGAEKPETNMERLVKEILNSSCHHLNKIPNDMVRLVADLIREEDDDPKIRDGETGVRRRVCRRLEAWKEVDSNTIDMMVEEDFRRGLKEWEKNQDQVGEAAKEIEIAIFGILVEEMSQELVSLP